MKTKILFCLWFALPVGGCGSGSLPAMTAEEALFAVRSCEPGAVIEQISDDMNNGLAGTGPEEMGEMYDVFFQVMKNCGKTQDTDFLVKDEWGGSAFEKWLMDLPPRPPYRYLMRATSGAGLCLSRKGMEGALISQPKWYCETGVWTDEIITSRTL